MHLVIAWRVLPRPKEKATLDPIAQMHRLVVDVLGFWLFVDTDELFEAETPGLFDDEVYQNKHHDVQRGKEANRAADGEA